jgi:hypothetical protein
LREVAGSITKLDSKVFHSEFKMESFHVDAAGKETFQRFRSLSLLKLKLQKIDISKFLGKFKWKAIKGKLKSAGFKSFAKGVGATLAYLLVAYLVSKWRESIDRDFILKQVDDLGPKIQDALAAKSDEMDALLAEAPDGEVYMNIRFAIVTFDIQDPNAAYSPGEPNIPESSLPVVKLIGVGYSRAPWDPTPGYKTFPQGCYQGYVYVHSVTVSELVPVKEVLDEDEEVKKP